MYFARFGCLLIAVFSLSGVVVVDCGAPTAPVGGSAHYTGTGRGSKALIECGDGMTLQGNMTSYVTVCTGNGRWSPDHSSLKCVYDGMC